MIAAALGSRTEDTRIELGGARSSTACLFTAAGVKPSKSSKALAVWQ